MLNKVTAREIELRNCSEPQATSRSLQSDRSDEKKVLRRFVRIRVKQWLGFAVVIGLGHVALGAGDREVGPSYDELRVLRFGNDVLYVIEGDMEDTAFAICTLFECLDT